MLNEDELKKELAERVLKRFFADGKSFEDNLLNTKIDEEFIANLKNELFEKVSVEINATPKNKTTTTSTIKNETPTPSNTPKNFADKAEVLVEALPYIQQFYG